VALETLKGVTKIGGESIAHIINTDPVEVSDEVSIIVNHVANSIRFKIQNGPIKEFGKNGCQVSDILAVAKKIFEELNAKYPCRENAMTITKLDEALMWQDKRTRDREARGVEGFSKK
jgi:hypothetical protein